jgi:hypothetical protein
MVPALRLRILGDLEAAPTLLLLLLLLLPEQMACQLLLLQAPAVAAD